MVTRVFHRNDWCINWFHYLEQCVWNATSSCHKFREKTTTTWKRMNTEKTIAILSIGLKHFDLFDGTRTNTPNKLLLHRNWILVCDYITKAIEQEAEEEAKKHFGFVRYFLCIWKSEWKINEKYTKIGTYARQSIFENKPKWSPSTKSNHCSFISTDWMRHTQNKQRIAETENENVIKKKFSNACTKFWSC